MDHEAPRMVVSWLKDGQSPTINNGKVITHVNVVPPPEPSARKPRGANAASREFYRRSSIQATRRGLAARVGKG